MYLCLQASCAFNEDIYVFICIESYAPLCHGPLAVAPIALGSEPDLIHFGDWEY
jgi:hypothetical protein